ncbi:hypothetical protein LTR94_025047 [Friedmanniomyces endolithicus]|nr:hypothetical protein LTR94_025047 [Friedmanniomyces endolithicus]
MTILGALSAVALVASVGSAMAQDQTAQQPSPTPAQSAGQEPVAEVGDVEVTARRLKEEVQSFISEVAAPPRGRNLARWDRSICVGVANLDPRYAQVMVDRIARNAVELGLDVEEPGCRPDIMIVAAADAEALAKALVKDDPNGFRPARNSTDRGSQALERFQASNAPVRWWHVSLPVSADTGELAMRLDGEEPPTIAVRDASRLRANIRDDLARVIVIIDVSKIGRIGFGALSDYIAMVALAQVEPDADTSRYNTVLNLFAEGADRSAGLTQWDKDYLASLYSARRDRARATQQTQDILRGMTGERDSRAAQDDTP